MVSIDRNADLANIYVKSLQKKCPCPNCLEPGYGVHSYYIRKIKDLPAFGNRVIIYLRARKFCCRELECPVKVFTERFTDHFVSSKRFTSRAQTLLLKMLIEAGAKPTERLSLNMSLTVSDTTLLRWLKVQPMPIMKVPIVLGIDDCTEQS